MWTVHFMKKVHFQCICKKRKSISAYLSVYFLIYCTVFYWVNCVLCIYSNNTCIGEVLLDFYSWPLWNRFRADKVAFLKVLSSLFIYSQALLFTNFSAPPYIWLHLSSLIRNHYLWKVTLVKINLEFSLTK